MVKAVCVVNGDAKGNIFFEQVRNNIISNSLIVEILKYSQVH